MTAADNDKAGLGVSTESVGEADRYGITCIPVDYFHVGQYRYTHLKDAIAEAERQRAKD